MCINTGFCHEQFFNVFQSEVAVSSELRFDESHVCVCGSSHIIA